MAKITFADLAVLEPRLVALLEEAKACHQVTGEDFCANAVFFGYPGHRPGIKRRLVRLVGWDAEGDKALATSTAYDVAYDTIYAALPDCRGDCACEAITRALVGVRE